jgi:hypothetical protein
MSFNDPYDRRNSGNNDAAPIAWNPEGDAFYSVENLPFLSTPNFIRVTNDAVEFDGWLLSIRQMKKNSLLWIKKSFDRWFVEDDSKENKSWIYRFIETFACACAGKL